MPPKTVRQSYRTQFLLYLTSADRDDGPHLAVKEFDLPFRPRKGQQFAIDSIQQVVEACSDVVALTEPLGFDVVARVEAPADAYYVWLGELQEDGWEVSQADEVPA